MPKNVGDGLGLYMKDLYPSFSGLDTSTSAVPSTDDKDALGEDIKEAEKVDTRESGKSNVLLALAVLVGLVVFFGAGK